ncbi:MAG: prepilin peptidase [Candidatus Thorarchaeota archaeon]|jgi:Flp pilus assembly protein protease CpaA
MALEISLAGVLCFLAATVLLAVYSRMDLQDRSVPNRVILVGGIVGFSVAVLSGHYFENIALHNASLIFALLVGYILFRIGAIGGADVKALVTISLVSPGISFLWWVDPVLEGVMVSGLEMVIMLLLGQFWAYRMITSKESEEYQTPALIPFLFVGFLLVQLLVLI